MLDNYVQEVRISEHLLSKRPVHISRPVQYIRPRVTTKLRSRPKAEPSTYFFISIFLSSEPRNGISKSPRDDFVVFWCCRCGLLRQACHPVVNLLNLSTSKRCISNYLARMASCSWCTSSYANFLPAARADDSVSIEAACWDLVQVVWLIHIREVVFTIFCVIVMSFHWACLHQHHRRKPRVLIITSTGFGSSEKHATHKSLIWGMNKKCWQYNELTSWYDHLYVG